MFPHKLVAQSLLTTFFVVIVSLTQNVLAAPDSCSAADFGNALSLDATVSNGSPFSGSYAEADFNGDGKQDLADTNYFANNVVILTESSASSQQSKPSANRGLQPAAAGDLDTTFNPGIGVTSSGGVLAIAVQPDGKILLGGQFTSYNGIAAYGLVRVNSNGSLDPTFHSGGAIGTNIYSIALQSDGKILIGGLMTFYDGVSRNGIARLNTDGTLDPTFDPGTGIGFATFNALLRVFTIAVQPDQKILVGGSFSTFNGISRGRIVRLNSDGSIDAGFDTGTGASSRVLAIGVQNDGTILVAGAFSTFNGANRPYIARLNQNGSIDSSFVSGIQTVSGGSIYAFLIQPDGKIVIGGSFNVSGTGSMLARLNGDGSVDSSFTSVTGGTVYALVLQTDGKIVLTGVFNAYAGTARAGIARANSNGTLDTTFTSGSGFAGGQPDVLFVRTQALALQLDGRILSGGFFTSYASVNRTCIVRINTDGGTDTAFDPGTGIATAGTVNCVRVGGDTKILIGGRFTGYNNVSRSGIARLNADGSLDTSFDPGSGTGANSTITALAIQADGKVLIGGLFTTYNGIARNGFARVNTNGTLDSSFGSSADGFVTAIAVQSDGRIIIGGSFTTYQGVTRNGVARLSADGSLDPSFNPLGTGFGASSGLRGSINTIAIQQDGKILVGGDFLTYNGAWHPALIRLNADGALDGSFNPGTANYLNKVVVQSDGRIVIGGSNTVLFNNGLHREGVARLNNDGSFDTAFDPGVIFDPLVDDPNDAIDVFALGIQPDGRIIVGGVIFRYDGLLQNNLVRAKMDGHIDTSFSVGSSVSSIFDTAIQTDGKILIAGAFSTYNGTPRNSIARLLPGTLTTIPTIQFGASSYSVDEAASQVLVQINRTGDLSIASTVDYATSDTASTSCNAAAGKASSRCDYLKTSGRLQFAANESTKTISIPIIDDTYNEGSETFTFSLANPDNANLGAASASITINDNDTGGGTNPIDQSTFFVRQHYFDFLNRQPDQSGLDFWTANIESCSPRPACLEVRRIDTSASFYLSIEFQGTGYLVERLYKTAFGNATGTSTFNTTHQLPVPIVRYEEFVLDTQEIARGIIVGQSGWQQQLEKNKSDFIAAFVQRARFTAAFPANMSARDFVTTLNTNAGNPLTQAERDQLENEMLFNGKTRSEVLRTVAEHPNLMNSEFNRAFVLMEYFGYLRRNPNDPQDSDYSGYDFWLTKLNQFNGNYINAEMVKAFLSSIEYRQRFGP